MAFFKMCLADNLQDASDCGGLPPGNSLAAARKLSEDWVTQFKKQKAEKLGELKIDKLITMLVFLSGS